MKIKPRKGVVLAGIPAAGADVSDALGREWLAAGLVTAVKSPPASKPTPDRAAPARPVATRGK